MNSPHMSENNNNHQVKKPQLQRQASATAAETTPPSRPPPPLPVNSKALSRRLSLTPPPPGSFGVGYIPLPSSSSFTEVPAPTVTPPLGGSDQDHQPHHNHSQKLAKALTKTQSVFTPGSPLSKGSLIPSRRKTVSYNNEAASKNPVEKSTGGAAPAPTERSKNHKNYPELTSAAAENNHHHKARGSHRKTMAPAPAPPVVESPKIERERRNSGATAQRAAGGGSEQPLPEGLKIQIEQFSLPDYAQQYFRQQKTLFNKAIPLEKNLQFSKSLIKESLLVSCDELNKEAIELHKGCLEYMGERKSFIYKDINELANSILKTAVDNPQLRDEIYVQLVKQTTLNPLDKSEEKAWELFTMLLETLIVPSYPFLEKFVLQHFTNASEKSPSQRIRKIATYCFNRLTALISKPRTPILPNAALLSYAKEIPFINSIFRCTLHEIIENQKQAYPKLDIPLVLRTLIDLIIISGGLTSVGIFRIAASVSDIFSLRKQLEESHGEPLHDILIIDPNIPACTLKLWLTEIHKPLIPTELYFKLMQNSKNWEILQKMINDEESFPVANRKSLYYLINFLQRVTKEENTNKMNLQNMAIVFSPALCRCPATDMLSFVSQTVTETEFCFTLLSNMPCLYPIFKI